VPCFCAFLHHIKEIYSEATHIYVVLDNWPTVHKHPHTLETFVETGIVETGIVSVFLPTYSPQSNPIELLWKQLSDEVLRLHRDSDGWSTLKERVVKWLDGFKQPSRRTIKMVGLTARPAIRVNAA